MEQKVLKELLEVVLNLDQGLVFYDDTKDANNLLYNKFPILHSQDEGLSHFKKFEQYFTSFGGEIVSLISSKSTIGHFDNNIGRGVIISDGCIITNSITIGNSCLINLNVIIGHDCHLEEFAEICPGVNISGNVKIGKETFIGANATILPNITIGNNCVIAAGSVVTTDMPNNYLAAGVPAIIKKTIV